MKKEKGITMVSLVIYVAVMTLVIAVMASIISNFYTNTGIVQGNVKDIIEFNKFNVYFLKEMKTSNNQVDAVFNSEVKAGEEEEEGEEKSEESYILFTSGNAFLFKDGNVYYNNVKICENLNSVEIRFEDYEKTIIYVTLNFKTFNKSIRYKMENIY